MLLWAGCRSGTEISAPAVETAPAPEYEAAAEPPVDTDETLPGEFSEFEEPADPAEIVPPLPAAADLAVSFRTPSRLAPGDSICVGAFIENTGAGEFKGAAEWEIFHDGNLIDRFGSLLEAAPGDGITIFIPVSGTAAGEVSLHLTVRDARGAELAAGSVSLECRDEEIITPPPSAATVTQSVFILSRGQEEEDIPAENLAWVPFGRELEIVYTVDGNGSALPPGRLETGEFPGGSAYSADFPGGSGSVTVRRRLSPEFPGRYRLPTAVTEFDDGTGASCPGIILDISEPAY